MRCTNGWSWSEVGWPTAVPRPEPWTTASSAASTSYSRIAGSQRNNPAYAAAKFHARWNAWPLTAKLEKVNFELARLKAWKFGAKTETMSAEQRRLFEETMAEDEASLQAL